MSSTLSENYKNLGFSKNHNFNVIKKLVKTLTTSQLSQLLPLIMDKVIHDKNHRSFDDNSDQTDLSIFTSEECFQLSEKTPTMKMEKCHTNSNSHSCQSDWITFPNISGSLQSTKLNLVTKDPHISNSMFKDHSNDNSTKKLRNYTKKVTRKYCSDFKKTSESSYVNTNCLNEPIKDDESNSSDYLVICDTNMYTNDQVDTTYYRNLCHSKSVYEINQTFILEYDDYLDFSANEEFCFVIICLNNALEKADKMIMNPIKVYNSDLISTSQNPTTESINTIKHSGTHSDISSEKCTQKLNRHFNYKHNYIHDSHKIYKTRSLEIKDGLIRNNNKNRYANSLYKSNEIDDSKIDHLFYNLGQQKYSASYKSNSNFIPKERNIIANALSITSSSLSFLKPSEEINQKGDSKYDDSEKLIETEIGKLDSISSLHSAKTLNILQSSISLSPSQILENKITKKIYTTKGNLKTKIKNKISLSPIPSINMEKKHLKSVISHKINKSKAIFKDNLPSEVATKSPTGKCTRRKTKKKYQGFATSKIVNGRFQHGWQCTYKLCQEFNSLKRFTCKNCLNTRWCYPPLSKRDVICADCGYINYKARLYCKKCKFLFVEIQ